MKKFIKIILLVTIALALIARASSAARSFNSFLKTLEPMIKNPRASYEEKMDAKYPRFYKFMKNVKSYTPPDSVIYIPLESNIPYGQPMWSISHIQIVQTMLYPRDVRKLNVEKPISKEKDKQTFIIVVDNIPQNLPPFKRIITFSQTESAIEQASFHFENSQSYEGLIEL